MKDFDGMKTAIGPGENRVSTDPYLSRPTEEYSQKISPKIMIIKRDGRHVLFDHLKVQEHLRRASVGCGQNISIDLVINETQKNIYPKAPTSDISLAQVLAAASFIERDPAYSFVAARLLVKHLFKEIAGVSVTVDTKHDLYREIFVAGIERAVDAEVLDARLLDFDLSRLAQGLKIERDDLFEYLGMKTLYERYFLKIKDQRIEMPQAFWMRVAMGLAINEPNKNDKALEFYNLLSTLSYVPSTPTLLHSGLVRSQLSSCFLATINDDLLHIFKCIGDTAQMLKWSGGVANDWSNLRATGALIKSINIESQGSIPFMKVANDTTAAINRSGRRRGASVGYLETWHYDIEDFLDLRRNTGDERRRTHDMNTANWIPDLFMKRVLNNEKWTLLCPSEATELHDLYGAAFEKKYVEYERKAAEGKIALFKEVEAKQLWRKMLSRLFDTGHPWITFKDAFNVRSPQDHAGVIHSSNLCTEIGLNTSSEETAVCNLGSINLGEHVVDGKIDELKLAKSINVAVRMLDNVIDLNFYPTKETRTANMRHRPVGLGVMGFQDALFKCGLSFDDPKVIEFADMAQEMVSYYTILSSSELAKERGTYKSYKGSKWDRGLFPVDTIDLLEQERGVPVEVSRESRMDWALVREHVKNYGMRNSNTMAIAPTATISNVAGCFPCIEPIYKNLYVKANMSGEFTVVNKYLVADLKKLGLWNQEMLDQLKFFDGSVQPIESIPQSIKDKYKESFEIDPIWLIKISAARAKWIDQSQSHNVFMQGVSGKRLHEIYVAAWKSGLKATYYLRTLGASQIEKSTLDAKKFGFTQKRNAPSSGQDIADQSQLQPASCTISDDPECEACQ